jgi:hypothetical protein
MKNPAYTQAAGRWELFQQRLRHPREPGIEGEELKPLTERRAVVILFQGFEHSVTFLIHARLYVRSINGASMLGLAGQALVRPLNHGLLALSRTKRHIPVVPTRQSRDLSRLAPSRGST